MKPLELAEEAARALVEPGATGVVLVLPKGGMPKGFPRGELLNEMERNGRVERTYSFDPEKVLAWLLRHELIEMKADGGKLIFREPAPSA